MNQETTVTRKREEVGVNDKERPVKLYELERVAEHLEEYRKQSVDETKEIKELLKDINTTIKDNTKELKEGFVTKDQLKIALAPYDPIKRFFWWVAAMVGGMALATLYQLVMNGIKGL